MVPTRFRFRDEISVVIVGGTIYAVVVLAWMVSQGLRFTSTDPSTVAFGIGYAAIGMFLLAAVPLYLLGRFSLVSPVVATVWILGDTVYQWLYGTHLHPLSSYLTVWPILLGFVLAVALGEAAIRTGLDRGFGRFGLRPLF